MSKEAVLRKEKRPTQKTKEQRNINLESCQNHQGKSKFPLALFSVTTLKKSYI